MIQNYKIRLLENHFLKMENYKILERAGEGAHGFVFKGIDLQTDKVVALKKITINPDAAIPKNTMREICAMRVLSSPYIVDLLNVTSMGSSVVLVMEYLPCSLADVIRNKNCELKLPQIKTYTKMMLKGISYMHDNKLMHRDIKPANLLISNKGVLKIADFGLARIYNKDKNRLYSHQVATRWYRAPELLYGSRTYTSSVDIWSIGCILAEMITRAPLFPGETDIEQLAIVLTTLGTPTNENWPDLKDLPDYNKIAFTTGPAKTWKSVIPSADSSTLDFISKVLLYDKNKRLASNEALKHHFFYDRPKPAKLYAMPKPKDIKEPEIPIDFQKFDEIMHDIHKINTTNV